MRALENFRIGKFHTRMEEMDVARVYISRRNEEELKKTTRRWNFFLDRETKLGGSKGMGGKEGKARKQNVREQTHERHAGSRPTNRLSASRHTRRPKLRGSAARPL